MSKFGLITPCGPVDDPLSHFRTALLTVAMALAMIVCAELSIDRPRMTHAIKIDLPFVQADAPPPHLVRPMHVLVIRADGSMTFSGAQTSVNAAREALRLATLRYQAGYSGFLEVLDAQRTLNISELALIRTRQSLLIADVDLMKALGGGWRADQVSAGL